MRSLPARRRASAALFGLVLVVGGCGSGENGDEPAAAPPRLISGEELPATVEGLSVHSEAIGEQLASAPAGYAEAVGLFSLRRDDRLMGTLQLVTLDARARPEDAEFRERMVTQLGGSAPRRLQVDGRTVWITLGSKERTAAWFDGHRFHLLTTRPDFERPRALLRTLLDVKAAA